MKKFNSQEYANKCLIDSKTRKNCKKCRFAKCLSVGMRVSWVLTQEERCQRMLQRSRPKLIPIHRESSVTSMSSKKVCNQIGYFEKSKGIFFSTSNTWKRKNVRMLIKSGSKKRAHISLPLVQKRCVLEQKWSWKGAIELF